MGRGVCSEEKEKGEAVSKKGETTLPQVPVQLPEAASGSEG